MHIRVMCEILKLGINFSIIILRCKKVENTTFSLENENSSVIEIEANVITPKPVQLIKQKCISFKKKLKI